MDVRSKNDFCALFLPIFGKTFFLVSHTISLQPFGVQTFFCPGSIVQIFFVIYSAPPSPLVHSQVPFILRFSLLFGEHMIFPRGPSNGKRSEERRKNGARTRLPPMRLNNRPLTKKMASIHYFFVNQLRVRLLVHFGFWSM